MRGHPGTSEIPIQRFALGFQKRVVPERVGPEKTPSDAVRPGDIYYTWLGAEKDDTDSRHRAVVVSREELNRGDYVVVVLMTSRRFNERRRLANCVPFRRGRYGLTKDCVAQADTISLVEKSELDVERGSVGQLDEEAMRSLIRAIGNVISADCEPS